MRTFIFVLMMGTILLNACQSGGGEKKEEMPAEAPVMKYTLTPFTESAQFGDAAITSMTYKDGRFNFTIGGGTYQLGAQTPDAGQKMCANSGQGQHLHIIVDNEPYSAQYTADFDYDIPDGDHYLLAFLSRSYHESIKTPAASVAEQITVANKSINAQKEVEGPMLFYSRPKGTYTGKAETEKVMLDFYLVNADLGSDYQVRAEINGEEHLIDKWQPYYIEGLPMGDNTIRLTLIGKDGNPVNAPLNPVERTFTLKADPAEAQ